MLKNLLVAFAAVLCGSNLLYAQNVFSSTDPIVTYNSAAAAGGAANPSQPAFNVMSKWVRTPKMLWSTSNFKSYIWNSMAFRVRYPNNYNPANASKYPVVVFFHGGGEIGTVYDNEDQLTWGAQLFEQRINNGEWNGFLIFPQETSVGWDDSYFSRVNSVLDTLQKYNNADPDRVISMGLSSGGYGAIAYGDYYPKRVAAILAASPAAARTLDTDMPAFVQVPVWAANGGIDINPNPWDAGTFYTDFRNAGGNIYQTYFVNDSHNTWEDMWNQKNGSGVYFTTAWWNNAHKAQPLVYYQNQQFCGSAIAARMAISPGYFAYEWQQNGATIAGANGNEYTATQAGQYRVHFMRTAGGTWSAWSPSPVVISSKACAADTLYAEHFNNDNYYNAGEEYKINNFTCQNGVMTSGTDNITQDAAGIQGNRFLVNFTAGGSSCKYTAGDKVWNTLAPVTVTPNTNYEYSFYMANQNTVSLAQLAPVINGTALISGFVQPAGVGNASWKKYTYTWNSGNATLADLGIINRSVVTTGNDFAIDEISFKLAPLPQGPSCVTNLSPANGSTVNSSTTATLTWNAAATATSYDVYIWTGAVLPVAPTANVSGTSYNATGGTASTVYNWYVVPKNAAGAATGCSSNKTNFTTPGAPVITGTGTGLKGDYYNTIGLTGPIYLSRTDATVNFNWGAGSPARSIDGNTFSVRWTGFVQPQYSQTYTFYSNTDDGVRLWVNGQEIISRWVDQPATENSGSIALTAGVKYIIKMEYYDNGGDASAQLLWSGASTPKAIIPQKQLYLPINGNRAGADGERMDATAVSDQNASLPLLLKTGVYPNPVAKGQPATLQLNSENGGPATLQVAGIAGNVLQTQQFNLAPGGNTKTVPTGRLAPGIYIIRIAGSADHTATLKLVVQ